MTLFESLKRSASQLSEGLRKVFNKKPRLSDESLEELEDLLLMADLGPTLSETLIAKLRASDSALTVENVKEVLAGCLYEILRPVERELRIESSYCPHVILVVGVNGNGKTTTIGKLAYFLKKQGYSVVLGACDTFRAAAIEQLRVWGDRVGCGVVANVSAKDPSSVAYDALTLARRDRKDVLLIDTAGRLHNKKDLMKEVEKIQRVLRKQDPNAPHTVILILDSTTGQNAYAQVQAFQESLGISGLIVTKLDGTARGGVLVGLAERFGLPVYGIGIGEREEDFDVFSAEGFSRSLVGLE